MKKISIIITIFIAGLAFFSCEEEEVGPVLNLGSSQAPALSGPDQASFEFAPEISDSAIFTLSWSEANYDIDQPLSGVSYQIQMDAMGNEFSAPVTLANTDTTSVTFTVDQLNEALLGKELPPNEFSEVQFRVKASINTDLDKDDLTSEPVTYEMAPYFVIVTVDPIYLLGNGTPAGWDNTLAVEMEHFMEGKFGIVAPLTSGADVFMKFISNLGAWAPQWGTDDSGTPTEGPLVYRPTEDVADPAAIPTPEDGNYKIVADTANLQYHVYPASETLYLLGDATSAGFDNTAALEMTQDPDTLGLFEITTTLEEGAIKFIEEQGQWAPQYGFGRKIDALGYKGAMIYRPTEDDPDPANIPVPSAGEYHIKVDIGSQKYQLIKQ